MHLDLPVITAACMSSLRWMITQVLLQVCTTHPTACHEVVVDDRPVAISKCC
jgi:hypothetical protein